MNFRPWMHWILFITTRTATSQLYEDPGTEILECRTDTHEVLFESDRRVMQTVRHDVIPGALCDAALRPGWYRFTLDGRVANMAHECMLPNQCGTSAPIWLRAKKNETVHSFDDRPALPPKHQVKTLTACVSVHSDCCAHTIPTQVRNCGDYFVYFLWIPGNVRAAVNCPAFCSHNNAVTVRTGRDAGVRRSTELTPRITSTDLRVRGAFRLRCTFEKPSTPEMADRSLYRVEWTKTALGTQETLFAEDTSETFSEADVTKIDVTVTCSVTVLDKTNPNTVLMTKVESQNFYVGLKVEPQLISMKEGESQIVHVTSSVPFHCVHDGLGGCQMRVALAVNEGSSNLPPNVMFGECSMAISRTRCQGGVCGSGEFKIFAVQDFSNDGVRTSIVETVPIVEEDPIWSGYSAPDIEVKIDDVTTSQCYSFTGPHVITQESALYDLHSTGTFLMYKAKNTNFQVHARVWDKCDATNGTANTACCHCGVAAEENGDVIVIDRCGRDMTSSDDVTAPDIKIASELPLNSGTRIAKASRGRKITVFFPSGSFVRVDVESWGLGITVQPSSGDLETVEGLCGVYPGRRGNNIAGETLEKYRLATGTSLFERVPLKSMAEYTNSKYCVCGKQGEDCTHWQPISRPDPFNGNDVTEEYVAIATRTIHTPQRRQDPYGAGIFPSTNDNHRSGNGHTFQQQGGMRRGRRRRSIAAHDTPTSRSRRDSSLRSRKRKTRQVVRGRGYASAQPSYLQQGRYSGYQAMQDSPAGVHQDNRGYVNAWQQGGGQAFPANRQNSWGSNPYSGFSNLAQSGYEGRGYHSGYQGETGTSEAATDWARSRSAQTQTAEDRAAAKFGYSGSNQAGRESSGLNRYGVVSTGYGTNGYGSDYFAGYRNTGGIGYGSTGDSGYKTTGFTSPYQNGYSSGGESGENTRSLSGYPNIGYGVSGNTPRDSQPGNTPGRTGYGDSGYRDPSQAGYGSPSNSGRDASSSSGYANPTDAGYEVPGYGVPGYGVPGYGVPGHGAPSNTERGSDRIGYGGAGDSVGSQAFQGYGGRTAESGYLNRENPQYPQQQFGYNYGGGSLYPPPDSLTNSDTRGYSVPNPSYGSRPDYNSQDGAYSHGQQQSLTRHGSGETRNNPISTSPKILEQKRRGVGANAAPQTVNTRSQERRNGESVDDGNSDHNYNMRNYGMEIESTPPHPSTATPNKGGSRTYKMRVTYPFLDDRAPKTSLKTVVTWPNFRGWSENFVVSRCNTIVRSLSIVTACGTFIGNAAIQKALDICVRDVNDKGDWIWAERTYTLLENICEEKIIKNPGIWRKKRDGGLSPPEGVSTALRCRYGCHGNGQCTSNGCSCFIGYSGPDCGEGTTVDFQSDQPVDSPIHGPATSRTDVITTTLSTTTASGRTTNTSQTDAKTSTTSSTTTSTRSTTTIKLKYTTSQPDVTKSMTSSTISSTATSTASQPKITSTAMPHNKTLKFVGKRLESTTQIPIALEMLMLNNSQNDRSQGELSVSQDREEIPEIKLTEIANGGECSKITNDCEEIEIFGTGFNRTLTDSAGYESSILSCIITEQGADSSRRSSVSFPARFDDSDPSHVFCPMPSISPFAMLSAEIRYQIKVTDGSRISNSVDAVIFLGTQNPCPGKSPPVLSADGRSLKAYEGEIFVYKLVTEPEDMFAFFRVDPATSSDISVALDGFVEWIVPCFDYCDMFAFFRVDPATSSDISVASNGWVEWIVPENNPNNQKNVTMIIQDQCGLTTTEEIQPHKKD